MNAGSAVQPAKRRSSNEVSVDDGARILGVKPEAMWGLIRCRQVRSRKLRPSRQIVVSYDSLIEYFEASERLNRKNAQTV